MRFRSRVSASMATILIAVGILVTLMCADACYSGRVSVARAIGSGLMLYIAFLAPLVLLVLVGENVKRRLGDRTMMRALLYGVCASCGFLSVLAIIEIAARFGVGMPAQCQPLFHLSVYHVLGAAALPPAFVLCSLAFRLTKVPTKHCAE